MSFIPAPSESALVSIHTTYWTIGICGLAAIISALGIRLGFRKAFLQHYYFPSDSPLRFMPMRCRFLFYADVLVIGLAANYSYYMYSLHSYRTAPIVVLRSVHVIMLYLVDALLTVGVCMRCAAIVAVSPTKQRRFIQVVVGVSFLAALSMIGTQVPPIATLFLRVPPVSARAWYEAQFYSLYAIPLVAVFPTLSIAGSAWALRANLRRQQPPAVDGRAAIGAEKSRSSMRFFLDKSRRTWSSTLPHHPGLAGGETIPRKRPLQSHQHHISYPINQTFKVLSGTCIIGWLIAIVATAVKWIGPVDMQSVQLVLQSLGILLEVYFEQAVKLSHQVKRARGASAHTDYFEEETAALESQQSQQPLQTAGSVMSAMSAPK
ncbi:hypothetical protein BC828DRAFT_64905 [Blastocladiella britannica]|nr:hypothetical protein BC828DRAFT_64905 [Blastocladiella britannica]